ncbi:ABC transporter ATP-binding protein [Pseudorhodoferax sp.]|uniref:ABC transporter ATP-binding protein n=1 Tax=Pseudorhodoferax sp. TaxID=1993553 RepID=UPI001B6D2FA1|nr:ABC transporter ATP-binding protein [Pseudorhodoferax sp.]MBP8144998.1 ABC transporter ATP-binding protein [Inhella sp.]
MQTLLEASALAKAYGPRPAVRAVSLQLRAGELLALLGPNGAGKSTTLSMLCGLTAPDQGRVAGLEARRIGLVPQEIALFEELGAARNVALFGALYGLSRAQLAERVPQVLAQVGLAERAQDRPQTFSGGMKRRLNIACALVHDPAVLLLDEPTAGVDPHSRNAIFEILEALKRQGKALLYTTHYMEEAERLADRIVIVDQGQVVAEGTLPELLQRLPATARLRLDLQGKPQLEALRALPGLRSLHQPHSGQLEVGVDELATGTVLLLEALTAQGVRVRQIDSGRATLEDVFLHLTGRALRD